MNSRRSVAGDDLCVAVNPRVRAYANKKGINSEATLRYLTDESHRTLSLKSKELSDWISKNLRFANVGHKITTAYHNDMTRWMKFFINYYLWSIEIVSNSCDLHKPQTLMASLTRQGRAPKHFLNFLTRMLVQPEEKYVGIIIKRIAENKNLRFEDASPGRHAGRGGYIFASAKNAFSLCFYSMLHLKNRLSTSMTIRRMKRRKKPVIFLTTKAGYMKKLAEKLKKNINANFYFLHGWTLPDLDALGPFCLFLRKYSNSLAAQKSLSQEFSKKLKGEKELFSYRGIVFADILTEKFERDLAPYIAGLHIWTAELDRIIKKAAPSLVISSGNRADDSIAGELCRETDIPAVFVSHGSFAHPKNEVEHIQWGEQGKNFLRAPFSFIALQSPLAEGYIRAFPAGGNAIKTGPLIWGTPVDAVKSKVLFEKKFNKSKDSAGLKIVLHAATQKPNNALRFHIYETLDEYVQSLSEVAAAMKSIPDALLVVKFRPSRELSIEDLKSLVQFPDNAIISVRESFSDMLGASDLLISFSSTTIEEALQNKIPVLLYGGRGRYQHVQAYEINEDKPVRRSAVYHIKGPETLKSGIKGILDLKLDRSKDGDLFEPYIYDEKERVSLLELMK